MPRRSPEPSPPPSVPEPELVIAGRAWVGGRLQPLEVGIDADGWIVRVGRDLRGARRRDLGEAVLLPSGVDLHVHFREPGPPGGPETIASGTLQSVLGGVGTVADMPNTDPPTSSPDRLEAKAGRVRAGAACDVLLVAAAIEPRAIRALGRSAGAFKLYAGPSTGVPDPPAPATWPELLAAVRATDLPIAAHAEAPSEFRGAESEAVDLAGWDRYRPIAAERRALEGLLDAAGTARFHLAHATTVEALERVRAAGHSAEVTPHHLLLSTRHPGPPAAAKVNPPLRDEAERSRLYEAFRGGRVPILASDHAPHPPEAKALPFARAPSGIAGAETMLPMLLALVGRGELPVPVLLSTSADRPARWAGLPVGRLLPGHRGNLYAVDFRDRSEVRAPALHGNGTPTPFEGRAAVFPREHYLGGQRVAEGREYVGGYRGRVVRPEYARDGAGGTR